MNIAKINEALKLAGLPEDPTQVIGQIFCFYSSENGISQETTTFLYCGTVTGIGVDDEEGAPELYTSIGLKLFHDEKGWSFLMDMGADIEQSKRWKDA
ncbi:hypothetical protein A3I27_04110 [Candidatus Giovannonibacteria bacterium RIFCSPLOWO2_02_FULL_43_11b]|uniref:Uncharacterized protein n=1 Tax=Candidatus Giovannonibacteria bacterium RIFCSPHIGHO2_12_FULL_43_15 TaxID=1798341 RepID=A0A1F5WQM0_9BACT|nr:MAG: hypothetical protein A2739_02090 [Candidatus Giovannonibacteria bacterium RIFCSPHIGHO2_01_FULL_43_100]OGF67113.1 MAG: hypothetical protein A3B97_04225 [Candidatus Giovannonibacteria bacterium RIFCSPHIGHO2_02_FULL_43_32]OGF77959.1 MAG: hypothetical protein A3F23_03925 [Candidatus Giovannonibacteria bacterium RIFCSPHIGHO2_12_FULL_43_15]OGF79311.1 MAG: hypothetical protein A3A15_01570 [Candidatus Giovannonibacteria bacterium RIFCSPLOWO2_01_FULL_43_60]OGF89287.1 MAG: hypothetical protein A3